jgi:hypothetical protein
MGRKCARYLEGMNTNNPRESMTGNFFILPALVDKKFVSRYLSSPTLVERMLWATRHTGDQWLEIVVNRKGSPNARTLIYSGSLASAVERLRRGEEPPHIGDTPSDEDPPPLGCKTGNPNCNPTKDGVNFYEEQ